MTLNQILSTIWPNEYVWEPYQAQSLLQMYLNSGFGYNHDSYMGARNLSELFNEPDRINAPNRSGFFAR